METKRATPSVGFFAYERGVSAIFATAAVAALTLIAVIGYKATHSITAQNPRPAESSASPIPPVADNPLFGAGTTTSDDPLSQLGDAVMNELSNAYLGMQSAGTYSSSTVTAFGESLAPYIAAGASYSTVTSADIQTDANTSYDRMMKYREDLRASLAPLLENTEPEYEIFARYADTGDSQYLQELSAVAENYRVAIGATRAVVVPEDAVTYHVAIVNAMQEFAATLDALVAHASDPFASVALLRGYNQAEADMLTSFNALTTYYKSKTP